MLILGPPATLQQAMTTRTSMVKATTMAMAMPTVRSSSRGGIRTLWCKGESGNADATNNGENVKRQQSNLRHQGRWRQHWYRSQQMGKWQERKIRSRDVGVSINKNDVAVQQEVTAAEAGDRSKCGNGANISNTMGRCSKQ